MLNSKIDPEMKGYKKIMQALLLDMCEGCYDIHQIDSVKINETGDITYKPFLNRDIMIEKTKNMGFEELLTCWNFLTNGLPNDYIQHFKDNADYCLSDYYLFRGGKYTNHGFSTNYYESGIEKKMREFINSIGVKDGI